MKRLFKEWVKTYRIKIKDLKDSEYAKLTILFNRYISGYSNKKLKTRRFRFKAAYTNKFMIRKWIQKMTA